MEMAIVLLTFEPMMEEEALEDLKKIEGVLEVHFLYGPYDAFVKIRAGDSQSIYDIVVDKIRSVNGIKSTMTCFIAD